MKFGKCVLVAIFGGLMFMVGSCSAVTTSKAEVIVSTVEEKPTQEEAERLFWQTFEEKLEFEVQSGTNSFDAGFVAEQTAEDAARKYYPNFQAFSSQDFMNKATEIIMEVYSR